MAEQELTSPVGGTDASAESPVDAGQTQPTSAPQTPAPQPTPTTEAKPPNLFELPEFRKVQSNWERQLADARRAAQEAAERARAMQMQGMDEQERVAFERDEARQHIQNLQQQLQAERVERQRAADIARIAQMTGAPFDVLAGAESYDDAWSRGVAHMRQQTDQGAAQKAAVQQQKQQANQVHVSPQAPSGQGADLQARYDRAMKEYDTGAALDIMFQAERQGIQLRLE